jgi:molybdate transport system regulatory protein
MLRPRCKVWLESDSGQVALSDWRVELLAAIERHGSLAEAARRLQVPYKTAWYKLKEMENTLGVALLVTSSGGAAHGATRLTPAAREAVRRYAAMTEGIQGQIQQRFETEFAEPLD